MYQNGLRLLKLINNLLDLAKIDTGKMKLFYSKTDLVALIKGFSLRLPPHLQEADPSLISGRPKHDGALFRSR